MRELFLLLVSLALLSGLFPRAEPSTASEEEKKEEEEKGKRSIPLNLGHRPRPERASPARLQLLGRPAAAHSAEPWICSAECGKVLKLPSISPPFVGLNEVCATRGVTVCVPADQAAHCGIILGGPVVTVLV